MLFFYLFYLLLMSYYWHLISQIKSQRFLSIGILIIYTSILMTMMNKTACVFPQDPRVNAVIIVFLKLAILIITGGPVASQGMSYFGIYFVYLVTYLHMADISVEGCGYDDVL